MLHSVYFTARYFRIYDYAKSKVITLGWEGQEERTQLDASEGISTTVPESGRISGSCVHLSKSIYDLEEVNTSRSRMYEDKIQLTVLSFEATKTFIKKTPILNNTLLYC